MSTIDSGMPRTWKTSFGQPYTRPGMHPKQFFKRQGHAHPVVRLELRHGDDNIGVPQHPWYPELAQACIARLERGAHEGRVVQVDEREACIVQDVAQP